jgi:hypothetical protein
VKKGARAAAATLVVTLSGGAFPWLCGVDRVVRLDQYFDGTPIYFRVCTEGPFGWCEDSPQYTQPAGTTVHLEIPMRFRPGRKTVTVASCNADGCAPPVTVEAEIPIQWELPNER